MDVKTIPIGKLITAEGAEGIKAGTRLKAGQFLAYASVFGNVDSYGDIVVKGAFTNTLAEWRQKSNRTIPILYGHDMSNPHMNIGGVLEAEEDDRGLKILGQFDDDETAQKVYRLVKAGRIGELSFAYETIKQALIDDPENPKAWRELQEVKLREVSVVPVGANPATEVIAVKSGLTALERQAERALAEVKAGRTLSKANEASLREVDAALISAKAALDKVLPTDADDDTPSGDDQGKSGVGSGARDAATSDDTAPAPGEEQVKAWVETLTPALESAVKDLLDTLGIKTPPPDAPPADSSSDLLVAELQILGLEAPSE